MDFITLRPFIHLLQRMDEGQIVNQVDEQIEDYCRPFEEVVELLDTIPGIARQTAEIIVSEIGVDMSRFESANHLSAWAGLAPGNNESAGKRLSGKARRGNKALGAALNQAAHAAAHMNNTYLSAQYHRLAGRRGQKKAIVAVAHSILVICYHIIKRKEPYQELGGDYFDKRRPEATAKRLMKRLEQLGFNITVEPATVSVAACVYFEVSYERFYESKIGGLIESDVFCNLLDRDEASRIECNE